MKGKSNRHLETWDFLEKVAGRELAIWEVDKMISRAESECLFGEEPEKDDDWRDDNSDSYDEGAEHAISECGYIVKKEIHKLQDALRAIAEPDQTGSRRSVKQMSEQITALAETLPDLTRTIRSKFNYI